MSTVVALAIVVMDEQVEVAPLRPELRVVVNSAARRTAEALAEALAEFDATHPPEVRL